MKRNITMKQRGLGLAAMLALAAFLLWPSASAEAGLRAYWAMDEGSGPTAADSSGNGNHGTLVADTESGDPAAPLPGPTTPPDWTAGKNGGGLLFSTGTGNYNHVAVPKTDSLSDLGPAFSFSLWIRQDSLDGSPGGGGGYHRVISSPNYEVELGVDNWPYDYFWPYGTPAMQVDVGTSYYGSGGALGTWHHLAITYDGTDLKKYINGTLVPDSVKNLPGVTLEDVWSTPGWENSPLKLGSQVWPNKDWFRGALDDVAIWGDGYLDANAVAGLADGTYSPLTAPVVPEPTTGLLAVAAGLCAVAVRRRRT